MTTDSPSRICLDPPSGPTIPADVALRAGTSVRKIGHSAPDARHLAAVLLGAAHRGPATSGPWDLRWLRDHGTYALTDLRTGLVYLCARPTEVANTIAVLS